jgi:hypothetical protein
MRYEPTFEWDEDAGLAVCILTDGERFFTGTAFCCEEDKDMISQKTGEEIAFRRARIEYLKFYRDTLKYQLKGLEQFLMSIKQSYKFNNKSFESIKLFQHIHRLKFDLDYARELIKIERLELSKFIDNKESFYQKIRKIRKTNKNTSEYIAHVEDSAQKLIDIQEQKNENI